MRDYILLYVNGMRHQIFGERGFQTLSNFLRTDLGLVGTKVVCSEGDCGSCTVLIGRFRLDKNAGDEELEYQSADSCIQYLYQLDCANVITVEGLKVVTKTNLKSKLSIVQQAMVEEAGSQCGFCTPGFVMSIVAMLEKKEKLTRKSIQEGLTGNLCRCTGYEQIIDAALSLKSSKIESFTNYFNSKLMLDDFKEQIAQSVFCRYEEIWNGVSRKYQYFLPISLKQALEFKQEHENVTVVAGGTDISVQINKERLEPNCIMSMSHLTELEKIVVRDETVTFGAKVTWSKLGEYCKKQIPQFYEIIQIFASNQIKNEGTLAGNIANASPIADSLPFLHVIDSEIELIELKSKSQVFSKRWVNINNFFHGYKQIEMNPGELITRIRFKKPDSESFLKLYKVSKRKDLDISTFTAGLIVKLKEGKIREARIAFGGVGPIVLRLPKVEQYLKSKPMLLSIFKEAGSLACTEISPISDVRASSNYRIQLAVNIFSKFFYEWQHEQNNKKVA